MIEIGGHLKTTWLDFVERFKRLEGNRDAENIFKLLSKDENITAMIDAAEMGKAALSGCIKTLDDYVDSIENSTFDLKEKYPKTLVGRMVSAILEPYGYKSTSSVSMKKPSVSKYFGTASGYSKAGKTTMKVMKKK